ncbi:MAG: permease [Myxococcota bacterium]
MEFLSAAWNVTLQLAPWLLVGAIVSGVLHVLLPPGFVRRNLRGRSGVAKAVLVGVPLPLCSCGVIPAGLGLKRDGASDGASVGFLIATPQTGVDSVLVSASMLGWPFALFKVVAALGLGLVGGYLTDGVSPKRSSLPPPSSVATRPRWRDGFAHAVELIRTIWVWLVVGVFLSAAITTVVPPQVLTGFAAAGTLVAILAALIVSLPLYVCATASVPVAAALVAGGFPPGAALVFLMAGPATNVATIGAVSRAFGARALGVYLVTIVVGSVALGWAFESLLPMSPHVHAHDHDSSWIAAIAGLVLSGLVVFFAVSEVRARLGRRAVGSGPFVRVDVEGLTCDGCVRKLETKLRAGDATEVRVDREAGIAAARGLNEDELRALVRAAGFVPR